MSRRLSPPRAAGWCVAVLVSCVLAACGSSGTGTSTGASGTPTASPSSPAPASNVASANAADAPVHHVPLRRGESRREVRMPASYTPSAPTGVGTDDYRCFLLDPRTTTDQMITGFDVRPGNPAVVHHVILFRVPPAQVAQAEAKDAATPGPGWTCFGDSGLGVGVGGGFGGAVGNPLDDAPWLGAWAPGGTEQTFARGFGEPFPAGSRVVMQVHYNLLAGREPDRSAAELRLMPASSGMTPLVTQLIPAPVELPCRPDHSSNPLCDRAKALADVKARFGDGPGSTADLLHLLCGAGTPGETQSCTRPITQTETIRAVAGHMHLLGKSITIEVDPGTARARTVLDIASWNFDDQGSHAIPPVTLHPGETVRVTCHHSQVQRDLVPSLHGIPDKYVVWGEGTTDEMCLGILQVTRP